MRRLRNRGNRIDCPDSRMYNNCKILAYIEVCMFSANSKHSVEWEDWMREHAGGAMA